MTNGDPERVAILFGIPTSPEEFFTRANSDDWDYGRQLLAGRTAPQAFDEIYAPVCNAAEELIVRAGGLGVSVYRESGLQQVREAFELHSVLVLVAHWRGSRVDVRDLVGNWSTILEQVDDASPLADVLAHFLSDGRATSDARRLALVNALNRVIESGSLKRFFPGGLAGIVSAAPLVLETLSRDLLDASLSPALRPGNQLELADGLHTVGTVDTAIPETFRGVLDLSCCTSSILGTYLKVVRGDNLDVIMGDQLIVPAPQLRMLAAVLEIIEQDRTLRYPDVRRRVARSLDDWYRFDRRVTA